MPKKSFFNSLLKRQMEDELYEATRGSVNEDQILEIRRIVTAGLEQIEQAELQFLEVDHKKTS